jgi:phytol kinase
MLRDASMILAILALSRAALWLCCWFDRRARCAAPELSRKLLHITMGLLLCPLPWIFDRFWPVAALCGVYVALLTARRFLVALDNHVAAVLDGVGRKSLGEFLFPIAVAVVFALAAGDRVAYLAPILILTLADAAAAIIGKRYGAFRFVTKGGCKSLEGSFAFAVVAFAASHLTFLLLGTGGRLESVLLALVVALPLTLVEAYATGGWDNLLTPLGGVLLIKLCAPLLSPTLSLVAGGVCAFTLSLLIAYALVPSLAPEPRSSAVEN